MKIRNNIILSRKHVLQLPVSIYMERSSLDSIYRNGKKTQRKRTASPSQNRRTKLNSTVYTPRVLKYIKYVLRTVRVHVHY